MAKLTKITPYLFGIPAEGMLPTLTHGFKEPIKLLELHFGKDEFAHAIAGTEKKKTIHPIQVIDGKRLFINPKKQFSSRVFK